MPNETPTYAYRVTAIVSVYKAERFMRACLEDLERQTIFAQTEVIIIDACSPENEGAIARQFMERHSNIVYVRTPERETLYASWNRAIGMARGQYLTNANADDRHAPHCFERLAAELDSHPNVGMAYAQCRVTGEINALFESAPIKRRLHWLPYDHLNFMRRCEAGPQPMWRAAVHDKVGLFDDTCTVVGDHDMWLRISELYPLRYVPEELGLYLEYDSNLESSNPQRAYDEEIGVKQRALQRFMSPSFKPHVPFGVQQREHAAALARLLDDVRNGRPVRDLNELEHHFYAYAALAARAGDRATAREILDMFFSIVTNSKNVCHLYRFVLCSSQGAGTGQLRVELAKDLPPLVSVVIPLYNQGQFLATAVASVLAQTEPRWEMCIINDGSTDNSLALAKEVLAHYNDPRIRLVSQANAGKGPTRNRGVRETAAPFVCVLDADDMLVPTYFCEALNSLEINPDAGWICPRTLVFGGNNHVIWSEPYDFFRSLLQCPCPVTAIYRRAVWDELGGYVESMIDREDWEFWVRAGEAGWTGLTTPTVQFIYRHAFQRFGQQPIPNLRSKQEYMALHEWWFRALPPKELRARLMAYSVGILPEDMLNPQAVEAVRPFVGQRHAFKKAVEILKVVRPQADSEAALRGAMPPKAKPAAQSPYDMDYLRRSLLSGSLDMNPMIALAERPNIFAAPSFCPALYALRNEDVRTRRREIDLYATALNTDTVHNGQWTLPSANLHDIVLFQEAQLPRCDKQTCASNGILLGTSIAPKRIPEQQQAIATWVVQGFDVISVNFVDEIAQLQPLFPQVRFISVLRDSMPVLGKKRIYIGDILQILSAEGQLYRCLGIVNSDVGLYAVDAEVIVDAATKGLLCSHRINKPSLHPHTVGYDAFFFAHSMVGEVAELDAYFLGEPWWDYALPLYAVGRGQTLLQASPPLCFHAEHSEQWDMESWMRLGRIFLPYLQQTLFQTTGGALDIRALTAEAADSHSLHWAAALLLYFCKHAPAVTALQGYTTNMPKNYKSCPPRQPASAHHYVTYFDKNYLAKGLTLITSLREHDPGCRVDVVCLDKETRQALLRLDVPGVRTVDIALIEKDDSELNKVRNERKKVEYYWSLTPTVILRLLEDMPHGEVLTYVDADLYFWSSPQPVFDEMEQADVLIHSHNFAPESRHLEAYGLYNVGLMCFRASEEGFAVLRWWRKKCLEWCGNYIDDDPEGGTRYGDQKYLERFHSISSAVRVCKHPGVGVAAWNHVKFSLSQNPAGQLCVDGQPIIMYHYHSFAVLAPGCALPSTEAYPLNPEIVQLFHIPYLEAWEKAHKRIRAVLPNFTEGFSPQALTPNRCILACAEQADTFRNEGLTDAVPLQNSRGEAYTLFIAPYLRAMMNARPAARRASPSLEASLANYRRFTQKPRLLNLGCGSHHHAAWLNVDIAPSTPGVHAVDLRGDWPLPENFFDVVYHSHVLEHMSQAQGTEYLRKCFAVLKPGGVLRVAVPDLEAIARNYVAALDSARQGTPGAEQRHAWMLLELIDQTSRHHSGGEMAEYFKQMPLPEKDFVLSRIGREGEQLANALQGKTPRTFEDSDPLSVGKFRLGGEVHRWMYDAWSLRRALAAAGFISIAPVDAVTSAWSDFTSFNLDADSAGRTRKPDSLFMEAQKPETVTISPENQQNSGHAVAPCGCPILETPPKSPLFWSGAFATWQSAVQATGGYDSEEIFTTVRNAARAVRDGLALWERDSTLFHTREYNMPLVEALLNIAKKNQGHLHVLDFGGALGSTYQQNKSAFKFLPECTWHIVEQPHFVECGQAEFSDDHMTFHYSIDEALQSAPINAILLSSVLQYLEEPYTILRQAAKTGLPIIIDRTSILADQECITIQHVPEAIYKASYAYHWLNLHTLEAIFAQHGYTLAPWWQSAVDPAGFVGTIAYKKTSAEHKEKACHLETTAPLRVMQADSFYKGYLDAFYAKTPGLARKSHAEQTQALFKDGFSTIHVIAPYLDTMGCITDYFVANARFVQEAWARENNIPVPPSFNMEAEHELLRRRIEWFKPDVLYLADPILFEANFLASLSFRPRCIVAWRAADIPFGTDWAGYDIILSGLPRMLALAESLGAKKGVLFHPGMPSWVARAVENIPQDTDVVFVGSISPTQHVRRVALLDTVAQAATQHGFSFAAHLLCNPACLTSALRPFVRPPVFGLEMHKALRRGRIVIDDRAYHGLLMPDGSKKLDLGGDDTSNMRLFEGTGGGSLVLTEALPGVARYFEPDKEAVLYTSHADAVAKILYYLEHEQERAAIAAAGKARCLGEHNINVRARAFLKLVRNAL